MRIFPTGLFSGLSTSTMVSPFFVYFLLLFLSSCLIVDGSIRVKVDIDGITDIGVIVKRNDRTQSGPSGGIPEKGSVISYTVVNERNETLFKGGDLAVFIGGRWCVALSQDSALPSSSSTEEGNPTQVQNLPLRPLVALQQETTFGTIPGLGNYEGVRIRWSCNLNHEHNNNDNNNNNNNNKKKKNDSSDSEGGKNVPIITSFLNFESKQAVLFDIEYPNGAENTSLVMFNHSDGDTATLATFPSFVMKKESPSSSSSSSSPPAASTLSLVGTKYKGNKDETDCVPKATKRTSYFPPTFPSALSWEGSFVQSVKGLSVGPRGGPTIFYNISDPALVNVVAVSPFFEGLLFDRADSNRHRHRHHFNQFTAGNNRDWTGRVPSFSPGRSGRLVNIPAGSSQSILLYQGSRGGITSTIHEWGTILQTASTLGIIISPNTSSTSDHNSAMTSLPIPSTVSSTTPPSSTFKIVQEPKILKRPKLEDVTLERIGYQTDNGAMYCFCHQTNCSEVLLEEKAYLESIGIPIGYLSFQGAGTSSGRGKAAPWCVDKWSADGGQDPNDYPLDMKTFQNALRVPLQLYAPYFCPNTTGYFQPDTPWKSLASNPDLPGCSGFAFDTVRASDAKAFFEWFLAKGIENGAMASFESDFMNQNTNCVDEFVESPLNGADEFLEGMVGAALGLGVPIQWCYASPNAVLASLNYPAVTNFRVSNDYCYGKSYEIGESSLLVWAMGASPSKDTLWTTDNNRTETPGCDWTVDHETVAAELHVVLAIMSTGPVGISDAIGMTNATLLQRIISTDGRLLQPSKPITAVDSSFLGDDSKPNGFLYGTHGLGMSWIFVSFQLRNPFPVTLRDFWPPLQATEVRGDNAAAAAAATSVVATSSAATTIRLVHRTFGSNKKCIHGKNAISSGCVTLVTLKEGSIDLSPVFVAPKSSFEGPGSDLSPNTVTVWKECPGSSRGIFVLGELDKYVALSPKRFRSLECSGKSVSATISGGFGEVVEIILLVPHADHFTTTWYEVVKWNVTVSNPTGLEVFDYRTSDSVRYYSGVAANETTADA